MRQFQEKKSRCQAATNSISLIDLQKGIDIGGISFAQSYQYFCMKNTSCFNNALKSDIIINNIPLLGASSGTF